MQWQYAMLFFLSVFDATGSNEDLRNITNSRGPTNPQLLFMSGFRNIPLLQWLILSRHWISNIRACRRELFPISLSLSLVLCPLHQEPPRLRQWTNTNDPSFPETHIRVWTCNGHSFCLFVSANYLMCLLSPIIHSLPPSHKLLDLFTSFPRNCTWISFPHFPFCIF